MITLASIAAAVIIALLDSGVDQLHPAFAETNVVTWDVASNSPYAEDNCPRGHGTNTASVIPRYTPEAILMVVKVERDCLASAERIALGVRMAVDKGADIITIQYKHNYTSEAELEAINYALSHDVVVIAAAGNDATDVAPYPAGYEGVIAVGCDPEEYGRTNYGEWIDAIGPCYVPVAFAGTSEWGWSVGTSFAAPYVAAMLARDMMYDESVFLPTLRAGG